MLRLTDQRLDRGSIRKRAGVNPKAPAQQKTGGLFQDGAAGGKRGFSNERV